MRLPLITLPQPHNERRHIAAPVPASRAKEPRLARGPRRPDHPHLATTALLLPTVWRRELQQAQQKASTAYRCQLSVGDRDYALHLKAAGEGIPSQRSYHDVHRLCARASRGRVEVDVLRVCRQIHDEAALLPFSSDHSFFATDASLVVSLHYTLPSQTSVIQNISLVLRPRKNGSWQHLDVTTTNTLLGLRELVCFAEVSPAFPLLQPGRFALYHCLRDFETAPLRCVTVAVYRVESTRGFRRWSRAAAAFGVQGSLAGRFESLTEHLLLAKSVKRRTCWRYRERCLTWDGAEPEVKGVGK